MVSKAQDIDRLMLMVLRLMDADILPPNEGNTLLAEIEGLARTLEETAAEGEADNEDRLPQTGEALVQTDRLDASAHGQTLGASTRFLAMLPSRIE